MNAGRFDFADDNAVHQSAAFTKSMTWRDSSGVAVNLTGYTGRMQVREKYGSDEPLLELTTSNGGITLGGSAGTIALFAPADDLAAIDVQNAPGTPPEKTLVYDLELTPAGGEPAKLLFGTFVVRRAVTR